MTVRDSVSHALSLGRLPPEEACDEKLLERAEAVIKALPPDLTIEETSALSRLFGPDDCYGLAWSLLHALEASGRNFDVDKASETWKKRILKRRGLPYLT